ncbi:putative Protein of unknown function (DUF667) [Blattamonas nauphoetae]|uniref:CFA20 domain-containing protein n=1 Tax=Blattamonas nauphoetae TaxID=2049346 RepID=A0ABQ9XYU7_9EUKA|nr:putative Protein of unknown function (DUF667) [Blattamonas nauphoetae]
MITFFQGGPFVDVLTTQGSSSQNICAVSALVKKQFDSEAKSYIYAGTNNPKSTLSIPKTSTGGLGLQQPYLAIQVSVPQGLEIVIQLSIITTNKTKVRLIFSTANKKIIASAVQAQVPLLHLKRGGWVNLVFDLQNFVKSIFRDSFSAIDSIQLTHAFQLRRIFTLRTCPPCTLDEQLPCGTLPPGILLTDSIPSQCNPPVSVSIVTQLYWMEKVHCLLSLSGGQQDSQPSPKRPSSSLSRPTSVSSTKRTSSQSSLHSSPAPSTSRSSTSQNPPNNQPNTQATAQRGPIQRITSGKRKAQGIPPPAPTSSKMKGPLHRQRPPQPPPQQRLPEPIITSPEISDDSGSESIARDDMSSRGEQDFEQNEGRDEDHGEIEMFDGSFEEIIHQQLLEQPETQAALRQFEQMMEKQSGILQPRYGKKAQPQTQKGVTTNASQFVVDDGEREPEKRRELERETKEKRKTGGDDEIGDQWEHESSHEQSSEAEVRDEERDEEDFQDSFPQDQKMSNNAKLSAAITAQLNFTQTASTPVKSAPMVDTPSHLVHTSVDYSPSPGRIESDQNNVVTKSPFQDTHKSRSEKEGSRKERKGKEETNTITRRIVQFSPEQDREPTNTDEPPSPPLSFQSPHRSHHSLSNTQKEKEKETTPKPTDPFHSTQTSNRTGYTNATSPSKSVLATPAYVSPPVESPESSPDSSSHLGYTLLNQKREELRQLEAEFIDLYGADALDFTAQQHLRPRQSHPLLTATAIYPQKPSQPIRKRPSTALSSVSESLDMQMPALREEENLSPPSFTPHSTHHSTKLKRLISMREEEEEEEEDESTSEDDSDIEYDTPMSEKHSPPTAASQATGDEVELLYDPTSNLFFDPKTGKYYTV